MVLDPTWLDISNMLLTKYIVNLIIANLSLGGLVLKQKLTKCFRSFECSIIFDLIFLKRMYEITVQAGRGYVKLGNIFSTQECKNIVYKFCFLSKYKTRYSFLGDHLSILRIKCLVVYKVIIELTGRIFSEFNCDASLPVRKRALVNV